MALFLAMFHAVSESDPEVLAGKIGYLVGSILGALAILALVIWVFKILRRGSYKPARRKKTRRAEPLYAQRANQDPLQQLLFPEGYAPPAGYNPQYTQQQYPQPYQAQPYQEAYMPYASEPQGAYALSLIAGDGLAAGQEPGRRDNRQTVLLSVCDALLWTAFLVLCLVFSIAVWIQAIGFLVLIVLTVFLVPWRGIKEMVCSEG